MCTSTPGDVLGRLLSLRPAPPLYAPGSHPLWTDPHISRSMLRAHLDPANDAASRRPETIAASANWIARQLPPGSRVLDLGCGPGLYASRLAAAGFEVTGVDWSDVAIRHAISRGSPVRYLLGDYRSVELNERFDAVLMIYLDLGTFAPPDLALILDRVRTWLLPGGVFIFDVATRARRAGSEHRRDWSVAGSGFWSPEAHLCLTRTLSYDRGSVYLDEHVVVTERETRVYRVWERCFDPETIGAELASAGLAVASVHGDLAGASYRAGVSSAIGITATLA